VLYQGANQGRVKKKKRGGKSLCTTNKYQQQKAKEPWLLPVFRTTFKNKSAGKYLLSYQRWFAAAL